MAAAADIPSTAGYTSLMKTAPPTQDDILRQLAGPARFRIALEMSEFAHSLAVAGLMARHPAWSAEDARAALAHQATALDRAPQRPVP